MAYYGNAPADVALVVGQDVITTTEIQDSTIATADIANDAITALKIDDDGTGFQMGSLGLGTAVSGSEKLTVGGTASFNGLTVSGSSVPQLTIGGTTPTIYLGDSGAEDTKLVFRGNATDVYLALDDSADKLLIGQGTTVGGDTRITIDPANGDTTFAGTVTAGHNSKITSSSADTTFKIETTSGTTIFPVLDFVSSHSSVGAKIRQDGSDVITIDNDQDVTFADDVTVSGLLEVDGSYLQVDNGGVRIDRHSNPPYILMQYDGTGVAQLRGVSGGGLNITNGGAGTTWQSFDSSGNATFNQNIITKSESNHTFTSSGTDNVAIKRQVWYSSYSSHNFQLSTTDSGSSKYLILSTLGSNGHIDWKISGSRMSQVYASITFTNYQDASVRTCYLEWSDDEGQNWNTVDTHGSWGAGTATVSATINTANGSSQTGGSSSGSSSGSNQIIIRARFVGSGGSYVGITNVTIKPTASYWTFVPVPRGYYNTVVSGITATTKTVQGTWTKMGRQVFIQAYINISGKSGGSGNPYIALPFTPSDIGVPASSVGANIYKNTSISGLVYFGLYSFSLFF